MKRWSAFLFCLLAACDQSAPVVEDLAPSADLSQAPADLSQSPADLSSTADLQPMLFTPAAVWWSTGGSSGTGVSGLKGGFSIGSTWVSGRAVAPSGAVLRFGVFSNSTN
jgi:hypothetical protein